MKRGDILLPISGESKLTLYIIPVGKDLAFLDDIFSLAVAAMTRNETRMMSRMAFNNFQ